MKRRYQAEYERPDRDSLIGGIYEEKLEEEISKLEKDAEREYRLDKARKKRRNKRIARNALVITMLTLMTAAVFAVGYKLLFSVKTITVTGSDKYDASEVIECAGVYEGIGLYSFNSKTAADKLCENLPYIKSMKVHRKIPSTLELEVEVIKPSFYAVIFGETYLFSEELKIMGMLGEGENTDGLTRIKMKMPKKISSGKIPELFDSDYQEEFEFVCKTVTESEMWGRINMIDLRSGYNITMTADEKYLLYMGDSGDLETKLRVVKKVLEDEMFDNSNKAKIDLSDISKTSVIVDNQISLE